MKRFKFRLERVLQYRKIVKDEKTRELLEARAVLHQEQERLRELETAALLNRLQENLQITAEEVQMIGLYGTRLRHEIADQETRVEESQEQVAAAQNRYVEAAKDEKSLVTLKGRKLDSYKEYVEKEDGKFLDELSVQRAGYLRRKE